MSFLTNSSALISADALEDILSNYPGAMNLGATLAPGWDGYLLAINPSQVGPIAQAGYGIIIISNYPNPTSARTLIGLYNLTYGGSNIPNATYVNGLYSAAYAGPGSTYVYGITNLYLDYSGTDAGAIVPVFEQIHIGPLDISFGGTVTRAYGINMVGIAGATTENLGIFIGDVTGTGAFAIKTSAGPVSFGDTVLSTASTTSRAGLRLPHGTAPTSPVNGDMWTTAAGTFIRINGVTKTFTVT